MEPHIFLLKTRTRTSIGKSKGSSPWTVVSPNILYQHNLTTLKKYISYKIFVFKMYVIVI